MYKLFVYLDYFKFFENRNPDQKELSECSNLKKISYIVCRPSLVGVRGLKFNPDDEARARDVIGLDFTQTLMETY